MLASDQQVETTEPTEPKVIPTGPSTSNAQLANETKISAQAELHQPLEVPSAKTEQAEIAHTPTESSSPVPSSSSTAQKISHTRNPTVPAVPIIPIKSVLPQAARKNSASTITSSVSLQQKPTLSTPAETLPSEATSAPEATSQGSATSEAGDSASGAVKPLPKSWAELVRAPNSKAAPVSSPAVATNGAAAVNGFSSAKAGSLAEALSTFSVDSESKIPFLKPRGLVNMGNMCYMNSVCDTLHATHWVFRLN